MLSLKFLFYIICETTKAQKPSLPTQTHNYTKWGSQRGKYMYRNSDHLGFFPYHTLGHLDKRTHTVATTRVETIICIPALPGDQSHESSLHYVNKVHTYNEDIVSDPSIQSAISVTVILLKKWVSQTALST